MLKEASPTRSNKGLGSIPKINVAPAVIISTKDELSPILQLPALIDGALRYMILIMLR